ncbi:MAG: hypothetical protein ACRDI2_13545 [Chloroflexota bacterium]
MSRILLLFSHPENRRLLAEVLTGHVAHAQATHQRDEAPVAHEVVWPDQPLGHAETARLLAGPFDLCILDGLALERLAAQVQARRRTEAGALVPFLLVSPRREPAVVARHLQRTVDEWLSTPVQQVELQARVATLLRLRRLSLAAAQQARLEGVLLAAHTIEHEISNTLTATVGYTERLAKDRALPPHLRDRATKAHAGAHAAAKIVRQLLALAEDAELPITNWGDTGGTTITLSPPDAERR